MDYFDNHRSSSTDSQWPPSILVTQHAKYVRQFLGHTMITPFLKSGNFVLYAILYATDVYAVTENTFNGSKSDVYENCGYRHFHRFPNTYC